MSGNFVFLFAVKRNDVNTQMTAKPEIEPQKTKEQEEWLRLKEGDREAFAAIFHQYYKDLVLYAGTFISHQAEAEDVVQDFFVKLWTEREHISAVKSVKPFLLTAVKHACLNALRGNGIKLKYGDVGVMAEECVTRETEDYILYSELNERLQEALKLLTPMQRQCFEMSRMQGVKQTEVAQRLGVSLRTVELRLAEALKVLKEELKEYLVLVVIFFLY